MEILCSGQAYFCENSHVSLPMISTAAKLPVREKTVSKLSVRRERILFDDQSVYHDFNSMLLVFVQRDGF